MFLQHPQQIPNPNNIQYNQFLQQQQQPVPQNYSPPHQQQKQPIQQPIQQQEQPQQIKSPPRVPRSNFGMVNSPNKNPPIPSQHQYRNQMAFGQRPSS